MSTTVHPNINILIVEDNLSFAIDLEMQLRTWRYEVLAICERGEEALDIIRQTPPDLILMDISLDGELSGLDIAKAIKNLNIPIIYMTGMKNKEHFQTAKNTTAISYLIKPFDMLTLKGTIDLYFKRQKEPLRTKESRPPASKDLFVKKNKELVRVEPNSIDWINSSGNYCIISTNSNRYIIKKSLKQTLNLLPKNSFIKTHKSYAVRINSITGILLSENKIKVGEDVLPLGRNYRKKLLDVIKYVQ